MALEDDIRRIEKINDFRGGNDAQRGHLNKMVNAINKIIEAADGNAIIRAFQRENLYYSKGGVLHQGEFTITGGHPV